MMCQTEYVNTSTLMPLVGFVAHEQAQVSDTYMMWTPAAVILSVTRGTSPLNRHVKQLLRLGSVASLLAVGVEEKCQTHAHKRKISRKW